MSRIEEGGVANHVGALDFFYRPTGTTFVRGMVSGSRTPAADGGEGRAAFAHLSNNFAWGYLGWIQVLISPEYRADTGFVPRPDLVTTSPAINLDLRPAWLPARVRSYTPGFTTMLHHRLSDGRFQEGWVTVRPLFFAFHDGSSVSLWGRADWQRLAEPFRPIPGFEVAAGSYDYGTVGLTLQPDLSQPYWSYVTLAAGGFYDRRTRRLVYRASPLPGPRLGLVIDYSGHRFEAPASGTGEAGGDPITTHLLGVHARATPSPRLQLTTFYQRNTAQRAASWNSRLSWEFRPLSFVYVVFNDGHRWADPSAGIGAGPRDRQLTLKVTWVGQL